MDIFECLLRARHKPSTEDRVVNKKDGHSRPVRSAATPGTLTTSTASTMYYYYLVLVLPLRLSLLLLLGAYYVPGRILSALSIYYLLEAGNIVILRL